MGLFSFSFERREGQTAPAATPVAQPAPSNLSLELTHDTSLGSELRAIDVADPRIFTPNGLAERAAEASRATVERFQDRLAADASLTPDFDKLTAHYRRVVLQSTEILKNLLPDRISPIFREYYSVPHAELARQRGDAFESYLQPVQYRAIDIARMEQRNSILQGLAVDVPRAASDFVELVRGDAAIIRAVSIREYPRGGANDVVFQDEHGGWHTKNDPTGCLIFRNSDIRSIELRSLGRFPQRFESLPVGRTTDGRHVIQQSGMQGCVAAATNMVRMDFGRPPDLPFQFESKYDNERHILASLERVGLRGEVVPFPAQSVGASGTPDGTEKRRLRQERGELLERLTAPGKGVLLSISSEIGAHRIVVDRFSLPEDRATVRDPLLGWSIVVRAKPLLARVPSSAVVVTDPHRE